MLRYISREKKQQLKDEIFYCIFNTYASGYLLSKREECKEYVKQKSRENNNLGDFEWIAYLIEIFEKEHIPLKYT